jgi:hypothetical protein
MHRRTFLMGLLAGLLTGAEHVAASVAQAVPSIPSDAPDIEGMEVGEAHYTQYRRYRRAYCDYYCRYERRLHTPWGYRRYLRRYHARQRAYLGRYHAGKRAYLRRYHRRQRYRRWYYDY